MRIYVCVCVYVSVYVLHMYMYICIYEKYLIFCKMYIICIDKEIDRERNMNKTISLRFKFNIYLNI